MDQDKGRGKLYLQLSLLIVLVVLALLPGFMMGQTHHVEIFSYMQTTRAQLVVDNGYRLSVDIGLSTFHPLRSGTELRVASLMMLTGLPINIVHYLPIGGLIFALVSFVLMLRISNSFLLASLFCLLGAWMNPTAATHYSVSVYAFGHAFFVALMIVHWAYSERSGWALAFMVLLLFLGEFITHHTVILWCAVYTFAFLIPYFLSRSRPPKGQGGFYWLLAIPAVIVILEIAFDPILRIELPRLIGGEFRDVWTMIYPAVILKALTGSSITATESYLYSTPVNQISSWLNILTMILATIPVAVYLVRYLRRLPGLWRARLKQTIDLKECFIFGVVIAAVVHFVFYMIYGSFSPRFVTLFFPFAAVAALIIMKSHRWVIVSFSALMLIASIISLLYYRSGVFEVPSFKEMKPSTEWILQRSSSTQGILMDFDSFGKLNANAVHEGRFFLGHSYDPNLYKAMVDEDLISTTSDAFLPWPLPIDFVVVTGGSYIDSPVTSGTGWWVFEPLAPHMENVENNVNLQRVYDDGTIYIYAPVHHSTK